MGIFTDQKILTNQKGKKKESNIITALTHALIKSMDYHPIF